MAAATYLIVHGERAQQPALREAVELLREAGSRLEVRPTFRAGDARTLAEEAVRLGATRVVAGGGDGTLNEIVAGIEAAGAEHRVPIGVLPLGTANDFARAAGVELEEIATALRAAVEGPPRPVDLGLCNHDYFVNVATGGTLSQLSAEADPRLKRALSGLAYSLQALSGLGSLTGQAIELRGPSCSWSGEAYVVGVGNGCCVGGGFELCPEASIIDGLLELTVIPADLELGAILSLISSGSVAGSAGVVRMRCPWVELRASEPIHLNLDGEPRVIESARFEAAPRAALMCLPPSSALLGAGRSVTERAV